MSSNNLRDVLAQVRSEKIKDRQDGLASLRTWFTPDKAVRNFDTNGDGKPWLVVYQALFTAVALEKKALSGKKATATAERRLSDVASFMRTLTERSAQRLNKKVVKALLAHFMQTMVHDGALLSYVALDYAKAIRSLLSWSPHQDHLEEQMWLSLVELSFNVILEDNLKRRMDEEDNQDVWAEEEEGEEDDAATEVGTPRKRRHASATPTPTLRSVRDASAKTRRLVTQEQTEFMAILSLLFQTSSTPLLSSDYPHLPNVIFARLLRFLRMYSADNSLQRDFLVALNALVGQLALNCKDIVTRFAISSWDNLVSLWNSKTKENREVLLSVLLSLLPYYVTPHVGADVDLSLVTSGISRLAAVLDENLDSRKGVEHLEMEAIQLGLSADDDSASIRSFHRRTFQVGVRFEAKHASTWATLTLHADCLAYLVDHGEGRYVKSSRANKRAKVENPVSTLVQAINDSSSSSQVYRLQLLLFLIDHHWSSFSEEIQREVVSSLVQVLSSEDPMAQSSAFMCLAAAAEATCLADAMAIDVSVWDQVWASSMRKMSNASLCRSAGHCASVLLRRAKRLLSSVRASQEIETFMSDLEVHGPPGLQDAVSTLFVEVLTYAHQDARLYHLKLEDKLLSWLPEVWRNPTESRSRARTRQLGPLYHVPSSLHLLEAVCGLQHKSAIRETVVLPDCVIVNALELYDNTGVIRDFLLHARLPALSESRQHTSSSQPSIIIPATDSFMVGVSGRERRTSALMLKLVEAANDELEEGRDAKSEIYAEEGRKYLDLAVVAMVFSASLLNNGIRPNRRMLQLSCRIVARVLTMMSSTRWTAEEKSFGLRALAPLVFEVDDAYDAEMWESMVPPSAGTGIKREALTRLLPRFTQVTQAQRSGEWRRHLWQDNDIQTGFAAALETLKDILRAFLGQATVAPTTFVDKDFEFAPRSGPSLTSLEKVDDMASPTKWKRSHLQLILNLLIVGPALQSATAEPIRDRDLFELFENCADHHFLNYGDLYLRSVRRKYLGLSAAQLGTLLQRFEGLLTQYTFSRSEQLQLLLIQFLDSTMSHWLQISITSTEVGDQTRELCHWLAQMLNGRKVQSWRIRDCLCQFLDRYLQRDPHQVFWTPPRDSQSGDTSMDDTKNGLPDDFFPCFIIPKLGSDDDIRVRFRVATINPRILATAHSMGQEPMEWYEVVTKYLSQDLDSYEHMLTRFLCLGNIMITSSSVRRAPYWHLLETDFHSNRYAAHLCTVLEHVSQRMGLASYAQLFEAYAPQIAYSIRQGEYESLRLSPALLGYSSLRGYAEASFRAFAPAYLSTENPGSDAAAHGQNLFVNHCKAIQKSSADGVMMCFGDIAGHTIITYIDGHIDNTDPSADLDTFLAGVLSGYDLGDDLESRLNQYGDEIITAILHTLGEQNFLQNGPIAAALQNSKSWSHGTVRAYEALTQFRRVEDFDAHTPNLPAFGAETVLQAVAWAKMCTKTDNYSLTYHVIQQLFADIVESSLVNEQLRLLNALTIWIACHCDLFQDLVLLRVLINGSASLMAQYDLVTGAQSLLSWCFGIYQGLDETISNLPDVLLFVSSTIYTYTVSSEDDIRQRGLVLAQWIHQELGQLARVPFLREQIVKKVLPAWSLELDAELAMMVEEVTSADISKILADPRISSNKFRLVKKMRDLAKAGSISDQFGISDFWRLKECIPDFDQLHSLDIHAFAELLIARQGRIVSLGSALPITQGMRFRHRRAARLEKEPSVSVLTQKPIVTSLRVLLENPSPVSLRPTYQTLRFLLADRSSTDAEFKSWPSDHRAELRYIATFQRSYGSTPKGKLNDLLELVSYQSSVVDFGVWVTSLSAHLSDVLSTQRPFFRSLSSYLRRDCAVAEEILPVLVHTLLLSEATSSGEEDVRGILSSYLSTTARNDNASLACLRSVVDIVLHLRNFPIPRSSDPLSHDRWLDLDFTSLSRTAIKCGAYTTALLFLELQAEHEKGPKADASEAEDVYYDIYSHIEEPDGFYGIQTKDLQSFLLRRFQHENEWDKAFRFYGAAIEAEPQALNHAHGMVSALHSFGFNRLALSILGNSTAADDPLTQHQPRLNYELGWRTGTWDLPEAYHAASGSASLYIALRAVHQETSSDAIDRTLKSAFNTEMNCLRQLGTENIAGIRHVLQSMMCLQQVAEWQEARHQTSDGIPWTQSDRMLNLESNFVEFEAMMATRTALLRSARSRVQRDQIGTLISSTAQRYLDVERTTLLQVAKGARESHQLQLALNAVTRAQSLESHVNTTITQELSAVFWSLGEQKIAIQSLKQLALPASATQTQTEVVASQALVLARLGQWTTEACLEKPVDIISHYFHPAVSLLQSLDHPGSQTEHAQVYYQFAVFAERQYQEILKSPDTLRYKLYFDRKQKEVSKRRAALREAQGTQSHQQAARDLRKSESVFKEDQHRYNQHTHTLASFREQAIDMLSLCMSVSDEFDEESIMRFISLWFANFEEVGIYGALRPAVERIASRKFVFMAHQLSARLSSREASPSATQATPTEKIDAADSREGQSVLKNLILRMCREHPFHSLYQVYCLRPMSDHSTSQNRRQSGRVEAEASSQAHRESAASEIFSILRGDSESRERVMAVEKLCHASLQWATHPIKKAYGDKPKGAPHPVPDSLLIRKIRNLRVPVTTARTPLDPTMRYDNCVWVTRYEPTFETAGGVNLPKISVCLGSDGAQYKQLFKGEGDDDMRQDAVMEQVFDVVNRILQRDLETKKRKLRVRDYKVIPLSTQAGLLEFVSNTSPIQGWLWSAHPKYRPTDLKHREVDGALRRKQREDATTTDDMLKLFLTLRNRFQPVFRHYFTECHKTPSAWFAMRLAYTRSVATTSIVGHIIGLGDRHPSNILMDKASGEVVHIDLGIAFDQGKALPVPERVPFRMTADMVDAMGVTGTQGVFQRCAEETLRVLRDGSETIMTVLEVFRHDPLHTWTVSGDKAKRVQGGKESAGAGAGALGTVKGVLGIDLQSDYVAEAADRALSTVARKLGTNLSVEYTVNELLAEATDPFHLANMFPGWGPQY